MIPYYAASNLVHGLCPLWMLCVCIVLEYVLVRFFLQKQPRIISATALGFFLFSDLLLQQMSSSIHRLKTGGPPNHFDETSLPLIVFVAVFLMVISILLVQYSYRWQRTHVTPMSVKESFDTIPAGVCFFLDSGLTELFNGYMDDLCMRIAGKPLINGVKFWELLRTGNVREDCTVLQIGENPMIRTPDGQVYSFYCHTIKVERGRIHELIAHNITEQFESAELLQRENAELQNLNERLRKYGEQVSQVTREREILNAKVSIHDKMNWILLSTRHLVEDGCTEEEKRKMFELWHGNVLLFCKSEFEHPQAEPMEFIRRAAFTVGLRVETVGNMPTDNEVIHVLLMAAGECITNAVRHAKATTLYIQMDEDMISISNDGLPPKKEIQEGGGLSVVRDRIQAIGGEMQVLSAPQFRLILRFKRKDDTI